MIRFEINQKIVPDKFRLHFAWTNRLLKAIEKQLKFRGIYALSVAFVDNKTMKRLNLVYRGKNKVTDILSFAGGQNDFFPFAKVEIKRDLGELILAWPYARQQAKKKKKTVKEELALLIVHGILHLWGFDHETEKQAKKMLPLQQKILDNFFKSNPSYATSA